MEIVADFVGIAIAVALAVWLITEILRHFNIIQ